MSVFETTSGSIRRTSATTAHGQRFLVNTADAVADTTGEIVVEAGTAIAVA